MLIDIGGARLLWAMPFPKQVDLPCITKSEQCSSMFSAQRFDFCSIPALMSLNDELQSLSSISYFQQSLLVMTFVTAAEWKWDR